MNRPYLPEEDAALLPYVARVCDWDKVKPQLPARSERSARHRLTLLRRNAGTLWRIDSAKLTRQAVRDIRHSSASLRALAAKYGVSKSAVHYARTNATWADA